jgi:ERCC4-type nuclease
MPHRITASTAGLLGLERSERRSGIPQRLLEQLVAWLPGVSSVGARALLAHFGTVQALFAVRARRDGTPARG